MKYITHISPREKGWFVDVILVGKEHREYLLKKNVTTAMHACAEATRAIGIHQGKGHVHTALGAILGRLEEELG